MKPNKEFLKFLLRILGMYILWFLLYDLWLKPAGKIDFWLTNIESDNAVKLLNWTGMNLGHNVKWLNHYIVSSGKNILIISHACNGLILYPIFSGLILVLPGPIFRKLTYMILGCLVIYIVNLIRIISLISIQYYNPKYLDFNHKYTFVIFVYSVIFGLWYFWINKFSSYKPISS